VCACLTSKVFTVSRSSTAAPEEDGPDVAESAAESEFVWASVEDSADATDLRERVDALEAELARVREQRDRLAAKAARVPDLERQVERLKNEKRTLIQARKESPQLVPADDVADAGRQRGEPPDARQRRRERRLWTYLKRQLF
jgi:predicted nuclease with TOPRIM domain